jgi:Na+/H+ antiporter NhaA
VGVLGVGLRVLAGTVGGVDRGVDLCSWSAARSSIAVSGSGFLMMEVFLLSFLAGIGSGFAVSVARLWFGDRS